MLYRNLAGNTWQPMGSAIPGQAGADLLAKDLMLGMGTHAPISRPVVRGGLIYPPTWPGPESEHIVPAIRCMTEGAPTTRGGAGDAGFDGRS